MAKSNKPVKMFLISEVSVAVIRAELIHMEQNMIHTRDTVASYQKIVDTLNRTTGAL